MATYRVIHLYIFNSFSMASYKDLVHENIITLLGLSALPLAEREHMLTRMTEIVMKRVLLRILDILPDADTKATFLSAVEEDNAFVVEDIVQKYVSDFAGLVAEETVQVKQMLVEDVSA
jgi:hypothetical protein